MGAGRVGDGAIVNWLSADDVRTVSGIVNAQGDGKEIVARIFVAVGDDRERVLEMGRFAVAAYLNVPVYAEFHRWLGRSDQLGGMWDAWAAYDPVAVGVFKGHAAVVPIGVVRGDGVVSLIAHALHGRLPLFLIR